MGRLKGRCLTTTLALVYGLKDPGVQLRVSLLAEFLSIWKTDTTFHKRVQRAWPFIYQKLDAAGSRRWNLVRGPISAVIATLCDAGWKAEVATRWQRPHLGSWEVWQIPSSTPPDYSSSEFDATGILEDFSEDIRRQQWARASQFLHSEDLAAGGDLFWARRELNKFSGRGELDACGLQACVVAGAQWPGERAFPLGPPEKRVCPRCLEEEETLLHRIWTCRCNTGHKDFECSDHLVPQALAGAESSPGLWLRGAPSVDLTHPKFREVP